MAETSAASTSSVATASNDVPPPSAENVDTVDAASSEQRKPADDDPEEDWGDGLKLKRSQAREALKRQREYDRASRQRLESANKRYKEAEQREQAMKEALEKADFDALMAQRGLNPAKWAEDRLTRELQRQQMTPEQRENETLRQQLQQIQQQQQQDQQQLQQQRFEESQKRYFEHYDRVIAQAVTDFGKLPKTPGAVQKVADVLTDYLDDKGNFTIDPKLAAEIAYENLATDTRQIAEQIVDSKDPRSGDMLADLLGPKVVAAIQKHVIAKAQGGQQPQRPRAVQPFTPNQPKLKTPPTMEDARKLAGLRF